MEIAKSRTNKIVKLHNEIIGNLTTSLGKAIQIGELLTEQKADLKHGAFTPWVRDNLPFTARTARNYMRLWRDRDRLKTETVADLKSAYKLLAAPKEAPFAGLCWVDSCLSDRKPDELLQLINNINEAIGDYKYFINTAGDRPMKTCDDGSMTPDELESFNLALGIYSHACFLKHFAYHNGVSTLPKGARTYLGSLGVDFGEPPMAICGARCQQKWGHDCI